MMMVVVVVRACVRAWVVVLLLFTSFVTCNTPFNVYWNVPSQQCHKHDVTINVSQFGIFQNDGDVFHGEKINILYRPGAFPYINEDGEHIQGGIPQNADMATHVQEFINTLNELVPIDFKGSAILDFEDYYPSYNLSGKYKSASREWVEERYPDLNPEEVEIYAQESFNTSSKDLFLSLLWVGRELRPGGLWGYYHYPYCNNAQPGEDECRDKFIQMNDNLSWLFKASAAIYPSVYLSYGSGYTSPTRREHVRAHLTEALRVRQRDNPAVPILTYLRFMYRDTPSFLSPVDMVNTLGQIFLMGLDGAVIWGASADVSTKEQCLNLKVYAEEQLGPLVQYLIQLLRPELRDRISSRAALKRITRTAIRGALRRFRESRRRRMTTAKPKPNARHAKDNAAMITECGNSIWDRCSDD